MSGSYWYAVNDAVVMFLFGSVALEVRVWLTAEPSGQCHVSSCEDWRCVQMKHRAPHNHTILEIIRVRWGVTAHVVRAQQGLSHTANLCTALAPLVACPSSLC